MNNYFEKLQQQVCKYNSRYPENPKKVALKLIWWNLKSVLFSTRKGRKILKKNEKIIDFLPTWIKITDNNGNNVTRNYQDYIQNFKVPQIPHGGHMYFDIDKLLKLKPQIKKIGLVFFMGMGDYFYATNFIEILHRKYPQLILEAFVSSNFDLNNSPLVAVLLEKNPFISKISYFNGHRNFEGWKNYDWSDCYNMCGDDEILIPMIYEHNEFVPSRTDTLCRTFNLPVPKINPYPIIYDYPASNSVKNLFEKYKLQMQKVVFIQMTTRSSNFTYPYIDKILEYLLEAGYFVICVEKTEIKNKNLLVLDIKKFNINETISLLKLIKENKISICFLTIMSVFASVSSALKIPNLAMQHLYDPCISTVYYSNIYMITDRYYRQIPSDRQYIIPEKYIERLENNSRFIYSPEILISCFDDFIKKI